jgi:hypothetical protein
VGFQSHDKAGSIPAAAFMTQLPLPFDESDHRDEALRRVSDNAGEDWHTAAMRVFRELPQGEFTGEDIRIACLVKGVIPHHHNAWGAFIMGLIRSGLVTKTGKRTKMKAPKSHARETDIYRKA